MATEDKNSLLRYYLDNQLSLWIEDTATGHWWCPIDDYKTDPEAWGPMTKLVRKKPKKAKKDNDSVSSGSGGPPWFTGRFAAGGVVSGSGTSTWGGGPATYSTGTAKTVGGAAMTFNIPSDGLSSEALDTLSGGLVQNYRKSLLVD